MGNFFKLLTDLSDLLNDEQFNDLLNELNDNLNELTKENKRESKNESKSRIIEILDKDDIDTHIKEVKPQLEITEVEKQNETEPELIRPSNKVSTEVGLQIHKLVQEYIDTMVKPYNPKNGGLSIESINNAYAGLYEFACWIYNK